MQIKTVRFQAFKSLYDVQCDLSHLTVLTGPNGAGKSNFVDALHFLGEVYEHGLEFAVSRAGGYENIAHRRTRRAKRPISIRVEVELTAEDMKGPYVLAFAREDMEIPPDIALTYRHTFSFRTASQSLLADFEVTEDTIELLDSQERTAFRHGRVGKEIETWVSNKETREHTLIRQLVRPYGEERFVELQLQRALPSTALVSQQMPYANILYSVAHALRGTRIYQLSPYQCRNAGVPTPNAMLERHGENLPGAADHLRRNDEKGWERVQRAMRSILPELNEIDVAYTEDRRLALQFRARGLGRPWSTGEVSDGTIQALGLFIALFDRRNPMLVVEEPENSVHPWILRQFIDLCSEVQGKQIVLTSHSPVLLNYVDPAIVRLMYLVGGRSRLRRLVDLSPDLRETVLSGEISLFDAYDSGALPEAVPRGFSPFDDARDEVE